MNSAAAPKPKSKREAPDRDVDFLKDRFGPTTSPIVRTIDGKNTRLVIDLESPSGGLAPKSAVLEPISEGQ